ncbi:hypothetical protein AN219_05760 [Streptomyces nanshensis]|nr:hypothetical protein AN219_05760 [Streptomyces nanshensis]
MDQGSPFARKRVAWAAQSTDGKEGTGDSAPQDGDLPRQARASVRAGDSHGDLRPGVVQVVLVDQ